VRKFIVFFKFLSYIRQVIYLRFLQPVKFIFLVSFCILFLLPSLYSQGQFEGDSKIHTHKFKIKSKNYTIQITLSSDTPSGKFKVNILPEFYDELMQPLDIKTLKKLGLLCELNTAKIIINPDDYCAFKSPGDSLLPLAAGKEFQLYFELNQEINFEKDLKIEFPFIISANKKDRSETTAELNYKFTKKPLTEITTESEKSVQEQIAGKTASDLKTERGTGASGAVEKPSGGKGGAGPEANPDSISTEPLEKVVGKIRDLSEEVYMTFDKIEEIPVTSEKISKFKNRLESIKDNYNSLFQKYSEVPKAEELIKEYEGRLENITANLIDLEKNLSGNENKELDKKNQEIAHSEKKNKTLQIILIVLGAILMAIVLFVLIKYLMKKVRKSFEKKMKRKAALELNKQKFKVAQQKNKLKV
jgi:hypothetical protein